MVRALGGVARTSVLIDAGHSRNRIATAVQTGALVRVRRGWVAVPDADAELVAAARAGVVLSCVTQARRLGLWVLEHAEYHVAAGEHAAGNKPVGIRVHWSRPPIPRHPDALVDCAENVLALVAECLPYEQARAVWESAIRSAAVDPRFMVSLPLGPAARRILQEASHYSDSGLETFVPIRLAWLRVRIIPQVWLEGHRVDFLIGDRLVLQIDGGHHVGRQRDSDIAHDARLMLAGYHVIRVSYAQVVEDWPAVQELIMRAVAQGLHRKR